MRDSSGAGESVAPSAVTVPPPAQRVSTPKARRRAGIAMGIALAGVALAALFAPGQEHLTALGTMNTGHGALACANCHQRAPGTLRQQFQAMARYLLGWRQTPADFGNRGVTNDDCLGCHERPFDRHPVFRFNEPRFAAARRAIAPQQCVSCHREHSGVRVSAKPNYCVQCHSSLELKQDPLDVPHAVLVREKRWETCLGCHDFHGNHLMDTAKLLARASSPKTLEGYFAGGPSPYPKALRKVARKTPVARDEK